MPKKETPRSLEDLVETVQNPEEPHLPAVLLLDVSGSMDEDYKIQKLNEGLVMFKNAIVQDEKARKRVDLCIITFSNIVTVIQDFASVDNFTPVKLDANGQTSMAEAIEMGIAKINERKRMFKSQGVGYYRPWIFMMTDGYPTDMKKGDARWGSLKSQLASGEHNKHFIFFSIGVDPADMDLLRDLTPNPARAIYLKDAKFENLFEWLSQSLSVISQSNIGDQIQLPPINV